MNDRKRNDRALARQRRAELIKRLRSDPLERLAELLDSGDEQEARAAAIALGDKGDKRAIPILIRALESADSTYVKGGAAIGLYELEASSAVQPLLRQIRVLRRDGWDASTLVWALRAMDARSAIADLVDVLCTGGYAEALTAVGVIEDFKGPLPPTDRDEAIAALRRCLPKWPEGDDRADMIQYVIERLEGGKAN